MNTEQIKPHILHNGMIVMHCWLKIKQIIYSIGFLRAPVVTQFILKYKENSKKSPIFESLPFPH